MAMAKEPYPKKPARTPLKRTPLAGMSIERAGLMAVYHRIIRELGNLIWHNCARCNLERDLDPHHPYRRGKGKASWKLFVFIPVCRECHDEIHANESKAREEGWLIDPKHKNPYAPRP